MTSDVNRSGLTRRGFLKTTTAAAGLAAGQGLIGFPAVHAADPVVLRIAGTGVNQFQQLADKAKEELGREP
ncbi:twin-arginine translocation signal domain-containing protein [Candidatus Entotheonella palauensis]|uniref:twin-arginine translocation signal domain-containing protein n=1 Tax=Candidatus Entotheonella palauensis TaxID=93172 RepID=UPI000B7DD6A4|nr:twin-arginine translocation signal domain-containing protein [Candidatus Entotheonella palauensis]